LTDWEARWSKIPDASVVFMRTGWSSRFADETSYRNTGGDGVMHFPGFSSEAAQFLLQERNIRGIGIITTSLDSLF
jgi:kynurenine formamidase